MTNPPINRKIAIINLVIASLMVTDTYFLRPTMKREFFDDSSHKYVPSSIWGRSGRGRTNFYVYTASSQVYKVPENVYLDLNSARDSFFIYKSALFRKPLKIKYKLEGTQYQQNIGMVNSGKACGIFLIYAGLISLLNLLPFSIMWKDLNQNLLFIGFFLTIGTFVIYFWWQ